MNLARRGLLTAAAALMATRAAAAASTELALMCDLTLGAPLRLATDAYRAASGVRIQLFPTAPGLIVPMLAHEALIDLVMTRRAALDLAGKSDVLKPGPTFGSWRTPLVVVEGSASNDKFAVSELPSASGVDATAALQVLNIAPDRIASAIDTDEVAFLLATGAAKRGLLYLTDAKAHPDLRVVQTLTDPPPAEFLAGIVKGSGRPNPEGFMKFLASDRIRTLLNSNGLETVA